MAQSVIITSPKPNNGLLRVMRQVVDDNGQPVGEVETLGVLDDGETLVGAVDAHAVLMVVEQPRNAVPASAPMPAVAAAEPAPAAPAQPAALDIPVIGGTQRVG